MSNIEEHEQELQRWLDKMEQEKDNKLRKAKSDLWFSISCLLLAVAIIYLLVR